jgi:hypothetical protein
VPRTALAIFMASLASAASGCSDIGQASSRRPHRSSTEATMRNLIGPYIPCLSS